MIPPASPRRPVRIIQIGFGHIGMRRTHLTHAHPGIDVVGVCDIKPERLKLARDLLGPGCELDVDFRHLIATVQPDAAIISTPNALHGPMTWEALRLGVHTLCEKPLTTDSKLGERSLRLAARKGLCLKVGSNHRYWRGVQELLAMIEAGDLGEITGIDGEIGYRLPDVRSEWYRERAVSGGGTIIDNTPHLLDVVNQVLRVSGGDRVREVSCHTTHDSLGLEVEDRAEGRLSTAMGRSISLLSTWSDGDYRMNLDIRGTGGRVALTGFDHLTVETDGAREERIFDDVPAMESWEMDIQAFLDAIVETRGAHIRSGAEGLQCVRIIEAMYESSRQGSSPVTLGQR